MANELKILITRRLTLLEIGAEIDKEYNVRRGDIDRDLLEILEQIADHAQANEASPKTAPKKRTKKKPKEPDHDATAKRYADFDVTEGGCLCGCGEDVAEGSAFVKGHHPRLKSISLAVDAGKMSASKMSDAGYTYAKAQGWIDKESD